MVAEVSVIEISIGEADQSGGGSNVAINRLDVNGQRADHDLSPAQFEELVDAGGVDVLANTGPASSSHAHRAAFTGGVQRKLLPDSLVVSLAGVELRAAENRLVNVPFKSKTIFNFNLVRTEHVSERAQNLSVHVKNVW